MYWVILMFDDKGPLLFIDSVQTKTKAKNQTTFDSREKIEDNQVFFNMKKLKNIIEMYNKNKPVVCRIITPNKEIEGIPFKLNNNTLYVLVDKETHTFDLSKLQDIEIVRF